MNRPTFRTDSRGVVLVLDVRAYRSAHPEADVCTCGDCGRSWDDAVVTGWTPAPSARCPYEGMRRYRSRSKPTGSGWGCNCGTASKVTPCPTHEAHK